MALSDKDQKKYKDAQRQKKTIGALAGLGMLSLAGAGGYIYYEEVYIPEQIEEAAQSSDHERFFEILPSLNIYDDRTGERILTALESLYEDGERLSDEDFNEIVDNHLRYDTANRLIGTAILENDRARVARILQRQHFSISEVNVDFDMFSSPYTLETFQTINQQERYSDAYAFVILLNAQQQDMDELADYIKSEFTFETIDIGAVMSSISIERMSEVLEGMELTDSQELQILSRSINNDEMMAYALEHYEYSDAEYAQVFLTTGTNSFDPEAMTLLLEQYTPSDEYILQVFEAAYENTYYRDYFNQLLQFFEAPQEITNRHYLELAARNSYQQIDEVVTSVQDQTVIAQGYIDAAERGNDEVMFVLDNEDITLTQEQIDAAFLAAAENGRQQAMLQIARNHTISEDLADRVVQAYIDSRSYNSIDFARQLENEITDYNRYQTILQAQERAAPQIAPTAPRP
jgi:hypothetical protein